MAGMNLIDLPDLILDEILSNLTFDEIAKNRTKFLLVDQIGRRLLNSGFNRVKKFHAKRLKLLKDKMPRRHSKKKKHCDFNHYVILIQIETGFERLNSTFVEYINNNGCFFPGKILDEIYRLMNLLSVSNSLQITYDISQEFHDLYLMAIEFLKTKIKPNLKRNNPIEAELTLFKNLLNELREHIGKIESEKEELKKFITTEVRQLKEEMGVMKSEIEDLKNINSRLQPLPSKKADVAISLIESKMETPKKRLENNNLKVGYYPWRKSDVLISRIQSHNQLATLSPKRPNETCLDTQVILRIRLRCLRRISSSYALKV